MTLSEIIAAFEAAPRMGAEKDEPEGVRYVQISETLLIEIISTLRVLDWIYCK